MFEEMTDEDLEFLEPRKKIWKSKKLKKQKSKHDLRKSNYGKRSIRYSRKD
jgi:hypothetical protein